MLNLNHTAALLTAHFPELTPALHPAQAGTIYQQLDAFAAYTRQASASGQLALLQECFLLADELLHLGDARLTTALETAYLHCLHLDGSSYDNPLARQLMPPRLYHAYAHQHRCLLP